MFVVHFMQSATGKNMTHVYYNNSLQSMLDDFAPFPRRLFRVSSFVVTKTANCCETQSVRSNSEVQNCLLIVTTSDCYEHGDGWMRIKASWIG